FWDSLYVVSVGFCRSVASTIPKRAAGNFALVFRSFTLKEKENVKKGLSILAVITAILFVFGIVSKHASADRIIFGTASADELETARQISFDILRQQAAMRSVG